MSIPKQYRVGCASFVQDELFMKLILYVLRTNELSQDELFIQLATLDQDDPYGRVWSSFLAPSSFHVGMLYVCMSLGCLENKIWTIG